MKTLLSLIATIVAIITVVVLSMDMVQVASSRIRYEPSKAGVSEVSPAQPSGE